MNNPTPTLQKRHPVIKCVLQTVERYHMFTTDENLLVGVSGGPDSMALLNILCTLAPEYRLKLAVAHLNHGLRPMDADRDELFVKEAAAQLGLPFYRHQADLKALKGSIEEHSREARYAFFHEVMSRHGYTKIALGHHKNDNAEALLMRLLRGSGIRGLAGIPPVRDQWVIRPLIGLNRAEIMDYLKDHQIEYQMDVTNTDPAYERNRIRHHLIPLLERDYNTNIVETLHRTAELCREEEIWFNQHLHPMLIRVISRMNWTGLELDSRVLASEPLAVQRRLIRNALNRWHGHIRRMGANHIDAVIALIPTQAIGKMISLPNGITARRNIAGLSFNKVEHSVSFAKAAPPVFCYTIAGIERSPMVIDIPECDCRLTLKTDAFYQCDGLPFHDTDYAWFDLDALSFPLYVRNFKPGDRIQPYGMKGTQKIKKLFIDRKINVAQRQKTPLLQSKGNLLWVVGIRRSNEAVVSNQTKRILSVKVDWSD